MELLCEPAVITAVAPAGPRDRRLTFLTRGRGGVRLYAKLPSRRTRASGFYEPLQGGELLFSRARAGAPARLTAFTPQRVWPGIRQDLARTLHALALLETLNLCLTEDEALPEVFALLVRSLDRLESDRRPGLVRIVATLRLLALSGFAPSLDACVGCRVPLAAGTGVLFSPEAGGVVCRSCLSQRGEAALPATPAAHGFLSRALALPDAQARRLRTSPDAEREISRLLDAFVEARTGVRPRAGACIEQLRIA